MCEAKVTGIWVGGVGDSETTGLFFSIKNSTRPCGLARYDADGIPECVTSLGIFS
jgi:hypothetical protein